MCGQILILQHLHWTYQRDLATPPRPAQMNSDTSTCWLSECCSGLRHHCWNTCVQVVVCRLENGFAFTLAFTLWPPSEVVLQIRSLISTWILIIYSVFHRTPSISHGDQQLVTNEQKKSRSTIQVFWSVVAPRFLRGQKKKINQELNSDHRSKGGQEQSSSRSYWLKYLQLENWLNTVCCNYDEMKFILLNTRKRFSVSTNKVNADRHKGKCTNLHEGN